MCHNYFKGQRKVDEDDDEDACGDDDFKDDAEEWNLGVKAHMRRNDRDHRFTYW